MQVILDDYSVGAALATDLVNTAPAVWRGEEHLEDIAELIRFLRGNGIVVDGEPSQADLDAVRALRSPLRAAIEAGKMPGGEDEVAVRAAALAARGGGAPLLERDDGGRWRWAIPMAGGLADRVALVAGLGLLGVLRALDANRFRACASPTCSGVFVDTSRGGRRRYCMPDLCGNRANVAAYRARRRAKRAGTGGGAETGHED